MAAPAEPGFDFARHAHLPGFRRQPPAGPAPGDRALRRQRHPRGSERARPAAGELHVPERTARKTLRHSEHLRQPVSPRDLRRWRARWIASAGQHSHGDVVPDAHVTGRARQVDSRQPARRAAAASAAERSGARRQENRSASHDDDAGSSRRTSRESCLRGLSSADGSDRLRAGELRRGGTLANHGRQYANRCVGHAVRWHVVPRRRRAAGRDSAPPGAVRLDAHRKTADVRHRPRRRLLRRAHCAQNRARVGRAGLPFLFAHHGHREQHAVSDEESIIMIISKKALPRRTFLRGMGATVALPLLDAMIPSMTALAQTPANPVRRLGFVYIPMGSTISQWTPPGEAGLLTELSPALSPLAPVMKHITIVSNMELKNAYPGTHATSNAAFLSAAKAKWTESSDYFLGTTVDQIAAKQMGQDTQLPSLELAMDLMDMVGQCDNGYACVYQNNLSWSSPTTPLPAEAHPRVVFERLFGEGGPTPARRAALRSRGSMLDSFNDDIARLKRRVGVTDRVRVDHYLDSIREVERQIERAEARVAENPMPDLERPVGVPAAFADHARLLFDLQVLAFQADITRVVSFQLTRELNNRTYPEIGVPDPHHPTSHHGNDPQKLLKISKINTFHVSLFAYFLEKLKSTPDGDGSLLDNTVYLYGSGLGNSSIHDHENLPILVAGGAASGMKGGRHIRYKNGTPLANLHLTLLDRVGVHVDSFGDSSGKIEDLFVPVSI